MKYLLLVSCVFLFACAVPAQESAPPALVINGKTLKGGELITRQDVEALCGLQIITAGGKGLVKPSTFQWVVSYKGRVWKGNCTTSVLKIEEVAGQIGSKAIVFIDGIILAGGIPAPQFAFTLQ